MVTVTDADREAAARIYQDRRDHDMASWVKGGKVDADWIVQAFAAHREAAVAEIGKVPFDQSDVAAVLDGATVSTQGLTLIATAKLTGLQAKSERFRASVEAFLGIWKRIVPDEEADAVEALARQALGEKT